MTTDESGLRCQMTESDEGGFRVLTLSSAELTLSMVPELGGRIISLRHHPTDRQWLFRPREERLRRCRPGESFADSSHIGIDECIPTVGACEFQGRALPDHGSAWTEVWTVDEAMLRQGRLRTTVDLPGSQLRFARTVSLRGEEVTFDYEVTTRSDQSEPFLWCFHPLFTLEPGDHLSLPGDVDLLQVEAVRGMPNVARQAWISWPSPAPGVRLDDLQLNSSGDPGYLKVFTRPLQEGWARLVNRESGARLELRWDARRQNTLGLWLTRGGYRDWHHLAVEPCGGAPDSLSEAYARGRFLTVRPEESSTWRLTLIASS